MPPPLLLLLGSLLHFRGFQQPIPDAFNHHQYSEQNQNTVKKLPSDITKFPTVGDHEIPGKITKFLFFSFLPTKMEFGTVPAS